MDYMTVLQRAIDYVEAHITGELDCEKIAGQCGYSGYHFRRIFGIVFGCTLTEYIRSRRLSLAGAELAARKVKVIDIALKYGYDNPDSFTRAFTRFHGVTPSQARMDGVKLSFFPRLSPNIQMKGENMMEYRIEEKPEMVLTGYKRHFTGVPYVTEEYADQSADFYMHTRVNQMLLRYMSEDRSQTTDYNVIDHVDEEGYDFYIAEKLTEWYHEHLAEDTVLGKEAARFADIVLPARTYAVFETERCKYPTEKHVALHRRIMGEWLPSSDYLLADAPEVMVIHWYRRPEQEIRYMEIWVPVEKK